MIGGLVLALSCGCDERAAGPLPTPDGGQEDARLVPAGDAPSIFLTVNEIPASMNGSEPFTGLDEEEHEFHLALPPDGFTLDVAAATGDDPVDFATLHVSCDATLGGGARAEGENLADRFQPAAAEDSRRWRVEAALSFPATVPGDLVTCQATVGDTKGRQAPASAVAFQVVAPTAQLLPFDDTDTWVLDFTRDLFAISAGFDPDSGGYTVFSAEGGNGVPEFLEELTAVGFRGSESAPGAATLSASGKTGVNAIVAQRLKNAIVARVRGFFHQGPDGSRDAESVPFDVMLDDDPGAPDLGTFSRDGTFSIMGMGGEGRPEDRGSYYGKSQLDPRNEARNDNSRYGLGVFITTALRAVFAQPLALAAIAPFVPDLGGMALGDDVRDPIFLADGFDPDAPGVDPAVLDRWEKFTFLHDAFVKALGALTAHEIGHSLGLVADGPPPAGLFGGEENAEFADPLTTPAHLDVEGLNLMAAGGGGAGLEASLLSSEEPFFTPLELAYFRARLWVLPAP